jgi:hypothetical protein
MFKMKKDNNIMNHCSFLLFCCLLFACNSQEKKNSSSVSNKERHYCDSLQIDTTVIIELRKHTDAAVEPFHYSHSKQVFSDGSEKELEPVYLQGFVFKETEQNTKILIEKLHDQFISMGYTLFVLEMNFGYGEKKDVMGILKTTDKYKVLREVNTNGINYDIDNDSLLKIIKVFDDKYALDLVGCSGDWCEFRIGKEPADWLNFAKEAYAVCPDIVDQGSASVEALADEMKAGKILYFWWD